MSKYIKVTSSMIGAFALMVVPYFASADQILASGTVTTLWNNFSADTAVLIALSLGVTLAALASLLGLGFAIRHVKKWVTGRKA